MTVISGAERERDPKSPTWESAGGTGGQVLREEGAKKTIRNLGVKEELISCLEAELIQNDRICKCS